ncbi:MAG: transposase [Bacilli bacterium]
MRDYKEGTFMRKSTKTYTIDEKLEIINYYRNNGQVATVDKYNISKSVFMKWERILIEDGEKALGLERRGRPGKSHVKKTVNEDEDLLKEVQRLRLENAYLKKLSTLDQEKQKKK